MLLNRVKLIPNGFGSHVLRDFTKPSGGVSMMSLNLVNDIGQRFWIDALSLGERKKILYPFFSFSNNNNKLFIVLGRNLS